MNNQAVRELKRHDFASVSVKENVPDLLEIQLASYEEFLQENLILLFRKKTNYYLIYD